MRTKLFIATLVVSSLLLLVFGALFVNASGEQPGVFPGIGKASAAYVPDEVIVKFKNDAQPFRVIKVPSGQVQAQVAVYSHNPNVVYAEPNYIAEAFSVPNDPMYSYQWNFGTAATGGIGMEQAWGTGAIGAGATVAIVDTGIAYENYSSYVEAPDLAETVFVPGYDFVNNDAHANDDNSHGTHVAGTVAQSTNNSLGVAGIAYGATLMPVKVLNSSGSGSYSNIASGIRWAADHGAKVINMSLGGSFPSTTLKNALAYAYNKGVTIVAAAGNNGSSRVSYPAAYDDYVIAVGATRYDKTLAYYSNYGSSLDIIAPGGDVNVDQNGDGYVDGILQNTFDPNTKDVSDFSYWFFQGTSMASPHVAGVAALLIGNGMATTPDQVRTALQGTALDLGASGWDATYGWGLLDAYAALGGGAPTNLPPAANAGPDQTGVVNSSLGFDGSTSSDLDGTIVSYAWDFGDGYSASGAIVSHTYSAAGSYTVSLTVIDDDGATGTDTANVTINPASTSGTLHISLIDMALKYVGKNTSAVATVTIVDTDGHPVSGALVSGHWTGATNDNDSGTADANGRVALESNKLKKPGSGTTYTFTVDSVSLTGWNYDSSLDIETTDSISVP